MRAVILKFLYSKDRYIDEERISKELIQIVRDAIGPVAAFRLSCAVPGLPRTRSGKTARKSIAQMAAGEVANIPPTIEDMSVYPAIQEKLQKVLPHIQIQDVHIHF